MATPAVESPASDDRTARSADVVARDGVTPVDAGEVRPRCNETETGVTPDRTSDVVTTTQGSETVLNATYTYRRFSDRPGVVSVTMRLSATRSVDRVAIRFREEVRVVETANVTRVSRGYEWTGERPATVSYRVPINWTYVGNRDDAWTLVEHRTPSVEATTPVDLHEQIRPAGEGYVGNTTVLLGEHEVYERRASGERIRVVVPAGVELNTGPRQTVEILAAASRWLSIGGRSEVVHGFATPQIDIGATRLEQPGFSLDDRTLLVDADYGVNTWTHEYVHTRQAFPETDGLRWLTEASAEYYGWLLSIEHGPDDWAALRGAVSRGIGGDSVLADPDSWSGEADYYKGALVLGVLDRAIRRATGGRCTVGDAIRRVNQAGDPTLETFVTAVGDVGGPDAAAAARRYLTTGAAPEYRPDSAVLEAVYGSSSNRSPPVPDLQSRVQRLAATRNDESRTLGTDSNSVTIRPDETLRVEFAVTNDGATGGLASLAVRRTTDDVDTERVATPWVGWIPPGETVTRVENYEFDRPGTYELVAGDREYIVRVTADPGATSEIADGTTPDGPTRTPPDGLLLVAGVLFALVLVVVAFRRLGTTGDE